MARQTITKEQMLTRVAKFKDLTPSARPLVDAVLPQFHREIFNIIGSGVTEDATMKVPITAVDGFHMSIIKAGPKKGTGLHDHKTVEVFMPLTGSWSFTAPSDYVCRWMPEGVYVLAGASGLSGTLTVKF